MPSNDEHQQADQRFPNLFAWLPSGINLYLIIAAFLLLIWLFFPVIFILGLALMIFWLVA